MEIKVKKKIFIVLKETPLYGKKVTAAYKQDNISVLDDVIISVWR